MRKLLFCTLLSFKLLLGAHVGMIFGYEEGGDSMPVYTGETATLNKGFSLLFMFGNGIIDDFVDWRFNWAWIENGTYVQADIFLYITDTLHLGVGYRQDILTALYPEDGSRRQVINSTPGEVYFLEFTPEPSRREPGSYFGLRYTTMDFTNPVTSDSANGDSLGFYYGYYFGGNE